MLPLRPQWGSKTQNGLLPSKTALNEKVCYKVSLCEYCQRQSCKASIGLYMRAKMVRGGRTRLRENLAKLANPFKTPIFNQYSLVKPQSYNI